MIVAAQKIAGAGKRQDWRRTEGPHDSAGVGF